MLAEHGPIALYLRQSIHRLPLAENMKARPSSLTLWQALAVAMILIGFASPLRAQFTLGGPGGGGAKSLYECPHGRDANFGSCPDCQEEREDIDCQRAKAVLRQKSTYSRDSIARMSCSSAKIHAGVYGFRTQEEIDREERRKAEERERERKRMEENRRREEQRRREDAQAEADRRAGQAIRNQNDALRNQIGSAWTDNLGYGDKRKNRLKSIDGDGLASQAKQLEEQAQALNDQAWDLRKQGRYQEASAVDDRASLISEQAQKAKRLAGEAKQAQSDVAKEQSQALKESLRNQRNQLSQILSQADDRDPAVAASKTPAEWQALAKATQAKAAELAGLASDTDLESMDFEMVSGIKGLADQYEQLSEVYEAFSTLADNQPGRVSPEAVAGVTDVLLGAVGSSASPSASLAAGAVQAFAVPIRDATVELIDQVGKQSKGLIDHPDARVPKDAGSVPLRPGPPPTWATAGATGSPSWGTGSGGPGWTQSPGRMAGGTGASGVNPTWVEPLDDLIQKYQTGGRRGPAEASSEAKNLWPLEPLPSASPKLRTRYDDPPPAPSMSPKPTPPRKASPPAKPPVRDLFQDSRSKSDSLRNRYD